MLSCSKTGLSISIALLTFLAFGTLASCDANPRVDQPLERDNRSGTGFGPHVVANAGMENPGLSGFRFDFVGEIDDEIERIRVQSVANGIEVEFSPTLPNHRDYEWVVVRQQLPVGTAYYRAENCHEGSGTLLAHSVLQGEQARGVPVLVGFYIWRGGGEDKVSEFTLRVSNLPDNPDNVYLSIAFTDHDRSYGDPAYCYIVDYAVVPEHKVVEANIHHASGRSVSGFDDRPMVARHPVLQGFSVRFVDEDDGLEEHNLDEVAVMLAPTTSRVAYNDKNDDDLYRWDFWYAVVKEESELNGPDKTGGEKLPGPYDHLPGTEDPKPPIP